MTGPESSPPTDVDEAPTPQRTWNLRYLFFAVLFVFWTCLAVTSIGYRADGWTAEVVAMPIVFAVLALACLFGMIRTRRTPPSKFRWAWLLVAVLPINLLVGSIISPSSPPAERGASQQSVTADGPQPTNDDTGTHPSPKPESSEQRNACSLVANYEFDQRLFGDSADFEAEDDSYDTYPLFTCNNRSALSIFVIGATFTPSPETARKVGAVDDRQTLDNVTAGWTVGRVIVEVSIDYSEKVAAARGVPGAKQNAIDTLAELRPVITKAIRSNAW